MFLLVDDTTIDAAARVHSIAWQDSHRTFCGPQFVAQHTPEQQKRYLLGKISRSAAVYLLAEDKPIGTVSVTGELIGDLYILPERQNRGYGTKLLQFAMEKCAGRPTLWILENNASAERLYRGLGFQPTGKRKHLSEKLDEIEFVLGEHGPAC